MTNIRSFIIIVALGFVAYIGTTSLYPSANLSFDRERLARIDAFFQKTVEDQKVAGARAVIMQNGREVYARNWGYRDLAAQAPMSDDTIFQIYSMTKPIMSVAVMMLHEEGHFRLSDPIAQYIPELANLRVYDPETGTGTPPTRPARSQPTIHDLLTHRAGFTYGFLDFTPVGALYRETGIDMPADKSLAEFVEMVGKIPLRFDPGTQWLYSISPDILGRLVEVVSGMPLGEFLEQRIFGPLDMRDTEFKFAAEKADRRAMLYSRKGVTENYAKQGFGAMPSGPGLEPAHPGLFIGYGAEAHFESGGGGLVSTTHDYLRFAQMLLNGGALDGVRLLAPNTVHMMRQNQIGDMGTSARISPTMPGPGVGFGLGFGMITDQGLSGGVLPEQSYFWGGAAGTFFWVDPVNQLTAIFMMQVLPEDTGLRKEFQVLTYQALSDVRLNQ